MAMTLAADLLLLAIDPQRLTVRASDKIDYALRGAELVELAIAERVTVVGDRIHVVDPRPTGDPSLDAALASIAAARRPPRAKAWVQARRKGLRKDCIAVLASQRAVRVELRPFLRVFTATRYAILDTGRKAEIDARITAIARGAAPQSAGDRALCGLTHACGLSRYLLPGGANRAARKRLEQVARRDRISADILRATQSATDAAVRAATDAAVHAATTAAMDAAHHAGYSGHDAAGGGGHH
jgi:hypothetical protein